MDADSIPLKERLRVERVRETASGEKIIELKGRDRRPVYLRAASVSDQIVPGAFVKVYARVVK